MYDIKNLTKNLFESATNKLLLTNFASRSSSSNSNMMNTMTITSNNAIRKRKSQNNNQYNDQQQDHQQLQQQHHHHHHLQHQQRNQSDNIVNDAMTINSDIRDHKNDEQFCLICRQNNCVNNECCHMVSTPTIVLNLQQQEQQQQQQQQQQHQQRYNCCSQHRQQYYCQNNNNNNNNHHQHHNHHRNHQLIKNFNFNKNNNNQIITNNDNNQNNNDSVCSEKTRKCKRKRKRKLEILNDSNSNNFSNNNIHYNENFNLNIILNNLITKIVLMRLITNQNEKIDHRNFYTVLWNNTTRTFKNRIKIDFLQILCVLYLVNFILSSVLCSAASDTLSLKSQQYYSNAERSARLRPPNGTVCNSRDVRNSPSKLENLRNCSVIEGFLTINLMEAQSFEFENASFPLLTEITEFLFVYRVKGLKSLGALFPNLSVIRGKQLFEGFALVIYENFNLVEIGLKSLKLIKRGAVRIEKNPELCFINTINWTEIVDAKEGNYFSENKDARDCPSCSLTNQTMIGINKEPQCWNFKDYQKICPPECKNNCNDKRQCCNKNCIGGCEVGNLNICHSCRDYVDNEYKCVVDCPVGKYKYSDRSCISLSECHKKRNYENNTNVPAAIFGDTCIPHCPDGYQRNDSNICVLCSGGYCYKACDGGSVDSLADARKFRGCSHIDQRGLIITLRQGGKHLMDELESAFSSVRVIETFLKVVRSFSITSLAFFKNLHTINGIGIKDSGNFSLFVLENNNLQHIWGEGQTVNITNGRVFFHYNEKLCYKDIVNLLQYMSDNRPFNDTEVPKTSNGNRGACDKQPLNTVVTTINSKGAVIKITNPIYYKDERALIAYQYYYIEAPFRNVTKHDYRNPCGSEGWNVDDDTKRMTSHPFTRLKPYTQYAYYVKTETIADSENGESEIDYFTTLPDTPMPIRNFRVIYRNLSSELLITWLPPARPNGNITLYKIKATLKSVESIPKMPYCKTNYKREELYKGLGYDVKNAATTIGNKNNENNDNCRECFCELESHTRYKESTSYYDYENSIVFEDAIQNFVFVKKQNVSIIQNDDDDDMIESNLHLRHRRSPALGSNSLITTSSLSLLSSTNGATISSLIADDLFPDNLGGDGQTYDPKEKISRWNSNKTYYTYFYTEVNASVNELVLKNLKYFSKYSITVVACHDGKIERNCSEEANREAETNHFDGADNVTNVEASLDSTTNRTYNVKVTWTPPQDPNGIILKYNIQYYRVGESIRDKCISVSEFIKNNETTMNVSTSLSKPSLILYDLQTGNYEIRVQAITQAGEGYFSDPSIEIYVPPTRMSWQTITVICIVIIIFLIITGLVIWYIRKKYLSPAPDLKLITSVNPEYISMQYSPDEWELPRDRIVQYHELGQGSFGMVYQGVVTLNRNQEPVPCAIKTVNENATDRERINFLNEASVMKEFNTHHVVKLLGVVSRGQPTLVVMELMQKGDLKAYLRQHRPDVENLEEGEPPPQPPTIKQLLHMALEIADGMAYLSAKKFVHRDLAARNCMVAEDLTVKIGDFGMTRDIYETDYYRKGTKGLLPVRWMSPESLKDGVFSSASDVFSFGVVLWEMATLASQPYQGLSNDQVLRYVIEGGIMESPQNVNCPEQFYNLMSKCWQFKPGARPTFLDIIQYLLDSVDEEADHKFRDVSFYYSPAGQEALEQLHPTVTDIDDATVPLRMGEYVYKISVEDTLSNRNHSNLAEDDQQAHSPYSLGPRVSLSGENAHRNSSSHKNASYLAAAMQSEKRKQQQTMQPSHHQKYQMEGSGGRTGSKEPYQIPISGTTTTNINYGITNDIDEDNNFPSTSSASKPLTIRDLMNNENLRIGKSYKQKFQLNNEKTQHNNEHFIKRLGRGIWNLRKLRQNKNIDNANGDSGSGAGGGGDDIKRMGSDSNGTTTGSGTKEDNNKKNNSNGNTHNEGQQQQGNNGGPSGGAIGSSSKKFLSSLTPSHSNQNANYQILNESNISAVSITEPSAISTATTTATTNTVGKPITTLSSTASSISNPVWQEKYLNSQRNVNKTNLIDVDEQCKKNNDEKLMKPSSYLRSSSTNSSNTLVSDDDKKISSSEEDRGDCGTGSVLSGSQQKQTPYQLKEQWLKQHLATGGNITDQPPNGFIGRDFVLSPFEYDSKKHYQQLQKQQYFNVKKSPSHNIDRSYTQDSSSPLLEMNTFESSREMDEDDDILTNEKKLKKQ